MSPVFLRLAWVGKALLFTGLLVLFSHLAAQDEEPEDVLIIEEDDDLIIEEEVESIGPGYWSQHFSGSLAGSYSGIGDDSTARWNSQLRLRYDEEWRRAKLALEGRTYRSYVKFSLENLNDGEQFTSDLEVDDTELLEGYVDLDLNRLVLSAGRKRIVWGQFDFFSPVDILLPLDLAGTTLTFSKVDNRLPQNVASAELFLPNGFEIHYYYFPNVITDALTSEFSSVTSYPDFDGEYVDVPFEKPADESQQALRLLYTGARATVGLTFFDGYNYFPRDFSRLVTNSAGEYLCLRSDPSPQADPNPDPVYEQDCIASVQRPPDLPPVTYHQNRYVLRPHPSLPPNRSVGFELAVPVGRMAYKFELSRNEIPDDLRPDERGQAYVDYINWIRDENGGRQYVDVLNNFYAIGFDYFGDRQLINFSLLYFGYEFDDHAKRAIELAEAAGQSDGHFLEAVFPVFHIAGNYGPNLDHRVGWALGTVGFAQGTTVYYQNTAVESMFFLVSLDVLNYLNDDSLVDQIEDEEEDEDAEIERTETNSVGIRLGFSYSF